MRDIFKRVLIFTLCIGAVTQVLAQESMPDDGVYVVQPKAMLFANRVELFVHGVYNTQSRYGQEMGGGAQLIYHIRENLAFSLEGGWFFWTRNSDVVEDLLGRMDQGEGIPKFQIGNVVNYYRAPWLASAEFQWSPLYGKIAFHDVSFGLFQIYALVGAGMTGLELRNPNQFKRDEFSKRTGHFESVPLETPYAFATHYGAGLRFYFVDHISVRLEIKDYMQARSVRRGVVKTSTGEPVASSFDIAHTAVLQFGVGILF